MVRTALKALLSLMLAVLLLGGALWWWADRSIDRHVQAAARQLVTDPEVFGLELQRLNVGRAGLSPLGRLTIRDISARAAILEGPLGGKSVVLEVELAEAEIALTGWLRRRPVLQGGPGAAWLIDMELPDRRMEAVNGPQVIELQERIEVDRFSIALPREDVPPRVLLAQLGRQLGAFITEGRTPLEIRLAGRGYFYFAGRLHLVGIATEQTPDGTALRLDSADVAELAGHYERPLTAAEIELLARNPLKAPLLLRIKAEAEAFGIHSHRADPRIRADVYRHVYWSYLLTDAFGPEFAEKVTDAHEFGLTGNTPEKSRMDLHNNAVGRDYALRGVPRDEVVQRIRTDPWVRREP
ncbi:MAG: hypothetical protein EA425_08565 [Puniceicoccaceae bacterium]|nr:MAG: hypothetical protein EA425_08565 [Puniceicoccaceae bacterium]